MVGDSATLIEVAGEGEDEEGGMGERIAANIMVQLNTNSATKCLI